MHAAKKASKTRFSSWRIEFHLERMGTFDSSWIVCALVRFAHQIYILQKVDARAFTFYCTHSMAWHTIATSLRCSEIRPSRNNMFSLATTLFCIRFPGTVEHKHYWNAINISELFNLFESYNQALHLSSISKLMRLFCWTRAQLVCYLIVIDWLLSNTWTATKHRHTQFTFE